MLYAVWVDGMKAPKIQSTGTTNPKNKR